MSQYELEEWGTKLSETENGRLAKKLWMLTWNGDWTEGEVKVVDFANKELDRKLKYCCYCKEVAPSTGHVHMHVLLSFNQTYRLSTLRETFPGFHYDACKGTLEQVMKYVKKDGNFKEFGNLPKTKKESGKVRWNNIITALQGNISDKDLLLSCPDIATHINKLPQLRRTLNDFKPETFNGDLHSKCLWLCGAAGTFKSHSVRAVAEEFGLHIVDKDSHTMWFTGSEIMDRNSVILIDDLQPEHFKMMLGIIKNIADRYPQTQLPVKGGHAKMDGAARVVITSNYSINEMLVKDNEHSNNEAGAIYRRFHEIIIPTGPEYTKLEDTMEMVRDWYRQYPYRDDTIAWFDQFLVPMWSHKVIYDLMGKFAGNKDMVLEHLFNLQDGSLILDPCAKDIYIPNPENSEGWEAEEDSIVEE